MTRTLRLVAATTLAATLLSIGSVGSVAAAAEGSPSGDMWYEVDGSDVTVNLYFVFSSTCPHCQKAMPFVAAMEDRLPWLRVAWLQADAGDPQVSEIALGVAGAIGESIRGVPTFMFCGVMATGYDSDEATGAELEGNLTRCHDSLVASLVPTSDGTPTSTVPTETTDDGDVVTVPIIGDVAADQVSLPVFTVTVAALDAFNPCAFFVLLFLLSLLVHAGSRVKMAVIGGVFVLFSGLIYFAFMAAWLNVFQILGPLRWITIAAGVVAITLALFNLKDYFAPDRGASLSIPESAKPGLFKRMRALTTTDRWPQLLLGTATLAVAANSYELLCTAGFPLVFTRVLTLNNLATPTYYAYLVLYNIVYVIPLLLIVGGFVWAFGSRKLQEREGRVLKLMSGTMMLGLGCVLLFAPHLLESTFTAVIVLGAAVTATGLIVVLDRYALHRRGPITS